MTKKPQHSYYFYLPLLWVLIVGIPLGAQSAGHNFDSPATNASDTILIDPGQLTGYWHQSLIGSISWSGLVDATIELEEAHQLPMTLYTHDSITVENAAIWFRFSLRNTSEMDTARFYLLYSIHWHAATLYQQVADGQWSSIRAGKAIPAGERSCDFNKSCLPVLLPNGATTTYWLQMIQNDASSIVREVELAAVSASTAREINLLQHNVRQGKRIFNSVFMGLILVIGLFAMGFGAAIQDRAYLYYGVYLLLMLLYYWWGFEIDDLPASFSTPLLTWLPQFRTSINTAVILAYFFFTRHFLDLEKRDYQLWRILRLGIYAFSVILLLDLAICWWPHLSYGNFFLYIKLPFIAFIFYFQYLLWRRMPDTLSAIYISGTLLMALVLFPMLLSKVLEWRYSVHPWGVFRIFETPFGRIHWLHTRTGLLLEVFCFLAGLIWKTSQERKEMAMLIRNLASQNGQLTPLQTPHNTGANTALGFSEAPTPAIDYFLQKADAVLSAHYSNSGFTTSDFAKAMTLSYSHCAALLKEKTGMSISLYIRQFRLEKAKDLLQHTDLPIREVAWKVGMKDAAYFSRLFKKTTGLSPKAWRESKAKRP